MKSTLIIIVLMSMFTICSCIDDKSNYDYRKINNVTIRFQKTDYVKIVSVGKVAEIIPILTWEDPTDTLRFKYEWKLDGQVVSTERDLVFPCDEIRSYDMQFIVIDTITGIRQFNPSNMVLNVEAFFEKGWTILYKTNEGKSEIGFFDTYDETPYYNLYRNSNHEELGEIPVKLVEHFAGSNSRAELLVIQHGGQGSVELNGETMKKVIRTTDEFVMNRVPDNFAPLQVSYLSYSNVILNKDGRVYTRGINDPENDGFHSSSYNYMPSAMGGSTLKASMLIESCYALTFHIMMFDARYGRFVCIGGTAGNIEPVVCLSYPENYTPLENIGSMKLIYASSYNDASSECSFGMILSDPYNRYYYQTFDSRYTGAGTTVTADNGRVEFPGGESITSRSKFWLMKYASYLFFTGGADNENLYCYNTFYGTTVLCYEFGSGIAAIHPGPTNDGTLGVGLKNGEFVLLDIYDGPEYAYEKFRIPGYGEIADVIYRYGSAYNMWE